MKHIKKLEVVVNTVEERRIIQLLDQYKIKGYTIIPGTKGRGGRGLQDGEGLTDVFQNSYFVIACSKEEFDQLIEPLRTLIKKLGGICMATDAEWLMH